MHLSIIGLSGLSIATILGFAAMIVRMWASNERAKSEMTINMLLDWTNKLDITMDRCVLLSSQLDPTQVDKIWKGEAVTIEASDKNRLSLELIFGTKNLKENGKVFDLCEAQVGLIEFHWKTYLNRLEFMLAAWVEQLIDEKIMLEQLGKYLSYKQQNLQILITERVKGAFPNTNRFLEKKLYQTGTENSKKLWIIRVLSK